MNPLRLTPAPARFQLIRKPATPNTSIADVVATNRALLDLPGVVDCGLFLGLAHVAVVGDEEGAVEVLERPD